MFEKYMHEEIEQSLLSKLMVNPRLMFECMDLKTEHFIFDENKKIFNALIEIQNKGIPCNPKNVWDITGSKEYVCSLFNLSSTSNVKELSEYLIEETKKYNALCELEELIKKVDVDKNVDMFAKLSEIAFRKDNEFEECSNESILYELEERINGRNRGIKTNIVDLDDKINSFQKGRLYIVGARPSMGKSAFMCSLVENIEKTKKVGILSLEMTTSEIKQRLACLRGNIHHWKIEKGKCTEDEFDEYAESLHSLKNISISDRSGLNRYQIAGMIRTLVAKSKCDIVFIDHIGLIKTESNSNLSHEIGENTSSLKSLAKELNIPIVGLCQLNRSIEKGNSKEPTLSDLRDSGRIEEDADCVILLYRDAYYNDKADGRAKYIVAKCRNGKIGKVDGYFDCELMKWS